jgi:hypothetical protein
MTMLQHFIRIIRSMPDGELIELSKTDMSEESDVIISALFVELRARLQADKFAALCGELKAA